MEILLKVILLLSATATVGFVLAAIWYGVVFLIPALAWLFMVVFMIGVLRGAFDGS